MATLTKPARKRTVARTNPEQRKAAPKPAERPTIADNATVGALVGLGDLKHDPANCRKHNPRNIGSIVNSLQAVGAARSIVIDEDNIILAGNGLVDAAGEAGIEKVRIIEADGDTVIAVRRVGLTPKQKAQLAIADNRTAELAEWDAEQLLKTISEHDIDLGSIEFNEQEIAALQAEAEGDREIVEGEIPTDVETRCKTGDLWTLGEHRLLCGDSTDAASWEKLEVIRPAITFTSPPYGVGENAKLRDHYVPGAENRKSLYASHADNPEEWPGLMRGWTALALAFTDCVVCDVQSLANNKRNVIAWQHEFAENIVDTVIWDKGHGAPQMQRNVLANAFEWVFILSPGNASRALPLGNFHGTEQNIVRINAKGTNEFHESHRATMPIDLAAWAIRVAGASAKYVVDPFGGTGTTMMAAQQLGRACGTIELDPTYCDIILARWEKLTGKTAERA